MTHESTPQPRADAPPEGAGVSGRKKMMCRVPPDMVPRIERAARRLGLSCSALMVLSTAEKLERMEG